MTHLLAFLKKYALPIKIITVLAIFALLFREMDWETLKEHGAALSPVMGAVSLSFIVAQIAILAYRWQIFMNAEKKLVTYIQSLNITTASQMANVLFIPAIGGIIVRLALGQYYGLSLFKAACAAIADRAMTFGAILAFAVLLLPFLTDVLPVSLIESVIGLTIFGLLAIFLFPTAIINFFKPFILKYEKLAATAIYIRILFRRPELFIPAVISSLFGQFSYFLAVYFAARATGYDFEPMQFIAMLPMTTLLASVPLGLGGWGVREGAFFFGLGLIGLPGEVAVLVSVQIGVYGILSVFIAAIPALFTGSLQSALRKARDYIQTRRT